MTVKMSFVKYETYLNVLKGRQSYYLVAILFLALASRLIFLDTSYFIWDETIYLMHGQVISGHHAPYNELFSRPPLLPFLISGLSSHEVMTRILVIFINSLIVIPVYFLGRIISERTALISSVIMAVLPVSILHSRYVLTDHLGALLALSSFVCLFYAMKRLNKPLIGFSSILIGLSILMKFTNLILLAAFAPLYLVLFRKNVRLLIFHFVILLITLGPFLIFSLVSFGNPLLPFFKGWEAVAEPLPVGIGFILYTFLDAFGLMLAFALAGLFLLRKKLFTPGLFPASFFFAIILFYYFFIMGKGVAKPQSIEWEAERFMLLLVPFVVAFASHSFSLALKRFGTAFFCIILVISFASLYSQYARAYTPQIEFENGLRNATKEAGLYLKDYPTQSFACLGNCPPVAYYSGKDMTMFFDVSRLKSSNETVLVSFSPLDLQSYTLNRKFCEKSSCSYVYRSI
ncbi:glycosyltransferase family 39 protein [Candidatus Woesearchaeota archaeon]|nr:glycosyltransferase family 39 protein [Candidatus Woesearchaeota archaeon]